MKRYLCDLLLTMAHNGPTGEDKKTSPPVASWKPIPDGVVDVGEDGRIVWSGTIENAPDRSNVTTHRINGIVMPGMINAHCHTPMVLLRGAGKGLPVDRWLKEVIWPRESRLTADAVFTGMQLGATELLTNGITTSLEMYFFGDAIAEAASSAGLRCLVAPPVLEDEKLSKLLGPWQAQLESLVATSERWQNNDLIDIALGPHALYSVSKHCLTRIAEAASDFDMPVHIHLAEQKWEDAAIRELSSGLSAPQYLESLGFMETQLIAAHCVWLSPEDISLMADNNVKAVHCPCSNTRHASGIAPVHDMCSAGISVSIGTDGPVSHNRLDLFEEMRTAIRLARVSSGDAQRFTAAQALWMTTAGAADVIGRGNDLGRLAPGYWADMVALSVSASQWHPVIEDEDDIFAKVVWSGSPDSVTDVWVAGRRVVEQGRLTTLDVDAEIAELNTKAARLAGLPDKEQNE